MPLAAPQQEFSFSPTPGDTAVQALIDRLHLAERRETELEAIYVAGNATDAQLAELEQVRIEIGDAVEALDGMGYYNPS